MSLVVSLVLWVVGNGGGGGGSFTAVQSPHFSGLIVTAHTEECFSGLWLKCLPFFPSLEMKGKEV